MTQIRLRVTAFILATGILGWFALTAPHTRDVTEKIALPTSPMLPPVTLRDSYKKGVHTITGSLKTPDACTPVTAEASLTNDASSTPQILVALTAPEDTGICLERTTATPFTATVTAPPSVPIVVMINGAAATTTP